jgi:hypothetical protein
MNVFKAKRILISISIVFFIPVESIAKVKQDYTASIHSPESILISTYTTSEPRKCRTVIDSVVKDIQKTSGYLGVKRINARRNLNNIWSNAPKGDLFDLDIGGSQKIPWFSDNNKMQIITTKMIKNCPDIIGTVVSIEGDDIYAYALVNGNVKKFICPNPNIRPFRWGYHGGNCSR